MKSMRVFIFVLWLFRLCWLDTEMTVVGGISDDKWIVRGQM